MRLRSMLVLLVIGAILPIAGFATFLSGLLVLQERDTFSRAVQDRNRAFMSAVDAELQGMLATLRAIASSNSLETDDVAGFHADARRALATQRRWRNIVLHDGEGRQLANALAPLGEALPPTGRDPATVERAIRDRAPVIGNVIDAPRTGSYAIPLRLPVLRDGHVRYVVTAMADPAAFEQLIAAQRFPEGWVSGLVDSTGRFIARQPARAVGSLSSETFRERIGGSKEGWYRGLTVEGLDTYTSHITSAVSGWSNGIAVPTHEVLAAAWRAAWMLVAGIALCLGSAIVIALRIGRRITKPIAALAAAAPAMGREAPIPVERTNLVEVTELARALEAASTAIRDSAAAERREKDVLQASDRAKDEFIAMLSHELRNPLSALSASAQILKVAKPGSETSDMARGVVERQTKHMTRLIEDLLDVSRITMGKATLHRETFDLGELVRRVLATWRESGRLPERRVTADVASVWVNADRARVEQILSNVLDNAVKFTPDEKGIHVGVASADGRARLAVADEGIGIPVADLPHVFDLFVQGPQDLSRQRGGMGVGLALVKRLVEMHGGSVAARSEGAGRGVTITIELPAVEPPSRPAKARDDDGWRGSRLRILVVEDDEDTLTTSEALFRLLGHEVRGARDGATGLAEAIGFRPDVVFVDIGLPDFDGYELMRRLRGVPALRDLRAVALTGYGQPEDLERARQAGFDRHITKPIPPEQAADLVLSLCGKSAASGDDVPLASS